jgi:hypothetical protein
MLSNFLSDLCDIYERSTVLNQFGDAVDTYTLYASNVRCRCAGGSSSFGQYGGRVSTQSTNVFYIDENYVLSTANTIKIDDQIFHVTHADAKFDGEKVHHNYYEVSIIESPQSGKSIYGL